MSSISTPSRQRLLSILCHKHHIPFRSQFSEFEYACLSIRIEEQTENLRNGVIEFFALVGVGTFGAVGATGEFVLHIAYTNPAPRCSGVFMATGATPFEVFGACTAVQPAVRDEVGIDGYFFH